MRKWNQNSSENDQNSYKQEISSDVSSTSDCVGQSKSLRSGKLNSLCKKSKLQETVYGVILRVIPEQCLPLIICPVHRTNQTFPAKTKYLQRVNGFTDHEYSGNSRKHSICPVTHKQTKSPPQKSKFLQTGMASYLPWTRKLLMCVFPETIQIPTKRNGVICPVHFRHSRQISM